MHRQEERFHIVSGKARAGWVDCVEDTVWWQRKGRDTQV